MKGKQLAILLALVVVLGGAWYLISERNRASWSETGGGGGKVAEFPINDVTHIVIKNSGGELNLVKKTDMWVVQERAGYPASFEQVSGILRKLWDLKTVQEVKAGPSQLPRLQLVEPGKGENAGTLVEIKDKDEKTLNALVLGKKHLRKGEGGEMGIAGPADGFPAGRYVKPLAGAKVSLVSETFDDAEPMPERWLSKDFIKIEGPKSIAVSGTTAGQRWSVSRENATAEWKLANARPGEQLDAGKTSALNSVFSSGSFADVLAPDAMPGETGLDKNPTTATIETFDGFRYELKIGKPNGDNYPMLVKVNGTFPKERTPGKDEKAEDKARLDGEFVAKQKQLEEKLSKEKKLEDRAYLVARFAVEPLLKDRAALFPDKPTAPGAASSPASVTPPRTVPRVEAVTAPVQAPPPGGKPAKPARGKAGQAR